MKLKQYRLISLLTIVFAAFGIFVASSNYVYAVGDSYYPQNTTVNLTVGGTSTNFLIMAGSDADSVTVNTSAGSVTVTTASTHSFRFVSSQRYKLTNNQSLEYSCNDSETSITITSALTTVITPEANESCTVGSTGGGGGGGGSGTTTISTPVPTPSPTATPGTTPAVTPALTATTGATPTERGFVSLTAVSLNDGDVISATGSDDPDVYIVNPHGYKRLFLNPAIFGFYGHLGGFVAVKSTPSSTRDVFVTSGLFRNCETDDPMVYGVEITGEDLGMLHWVNTTGEQAVADDPDFFKKVFCINTAEFNWYPKGADYTSVNQIPDYAREGTSSLGIVSASSQYRVVSSVGYLNVRASATTASIVLGKLSAGDVVESLGQNGAWRNIMFEGQSAWAHGDYLEAI